MAFSVIVLEGEDVKSIIEILRRLPDVANIRILRGVSKLRVKDPYILISPCIRTIDKLIAKIIDFLEKTLPKSSDYDILILPLKPYDSNRGRRGDFRYILSIVKKTAKLFLAKLASSVSRVLVPEITYSALDLIIVRGDLLMKCNKSLKSLSSFLTSLFQRALYYSEYRIYKSGLPIEVDLNELDIPVQDIVKYVHMLFSTSDYRVFKFMCVGLSGVIVNLGMLHLLYGMLMLPLFLAGFIAIESSIVNNFVWNSVWTFRLKVRKNTLKDSLIRLLKYHVAVGVGALVNYIVLLVLVKIAGLNYILSNIIGIGLGAIANYLLSDRFVWRICRR